MADSLTTICSLFFVMTVLAFSAILFCQFRHLQPATYRLIVLSTRTALFLPLCALLIFIALVAPSSYVMMIFLVTIIEGYAFNSFFALITTNLGGPTASVQLMSKSDRKLVCSFCLPTDSVVFFRKTAWALFHVFVTRSVLGLISAICFYANTDAGKSAYVFFNAISTVVLFYGVVCLVNLYENVYEYCINLFGVLKLVLLKATVGLIVVQGLIESILYSSGKVSYDHDDTYTGEQKALRAYCGLVLLEFALISVVYFYAYGDHKITPPAAPAAVRAFLTDRRSPYQVSVSGVKAVETLVYSFPLFVYDVLSVRDILMPGYFAVSDGDADLSEPLNDPSNGGDLESGRGGQGGRAAPWGRNTRAGAGYTSLSTAADPDGGAPKLALDVSALNRSGSSGGGGGGKNSPFVTMEDVYGPLSAKSPEMQFSNPDHLRSSVPNSPTIDYNTIYAEFSDVCDQNDSINL